MNYQSVKWLSIESDDHNPRLFILPLEITDKLATEHPGSTTPAFFAMAIAMGWQKPDNVAGSSAPAIMVGLFVASGGLLFGYDTG